MAEVHQIPIPQKILLFIAPKNQGTSIVQPIRRKKAIPPDRYTLVFTDFNTLKAAAAYVRNLTGKEVQTEEDIEAALNEQEDKKLENDDDAFYNFNKFKVLEDDES